MTAAAALEVRHLTKSFVGVTVLNDVNLDIRAGEIHGLIGQNGSGKSTLIKILAGFHTPDAAAEFIVEGSPVDHMDRRGRGNLGLAFIHQDLALVKSLSVLENVRIQHFSTGFAGRIRWEHEAQETSKYLSRLGLDIDPRTRVDDLSVTDQALVAIARGLATLDVLRAEHKGGLLVLDEPTAYLPREGVDRLFNSLRGLAAKGTSILFVSHRLDEILTLCDRVSILRDGVLVDTVDTSSTGENALIELMLGQSLGDMYPDHVESSETAAVQVRGLSGASLDDVSFEIRSGEIVGVTGLPGMGFEAIPYAITGAARPRSGQMTLGEESLDLTRLSPAQAIKRGIYLLPADRKAHGGAIGLTVRENVSLPFLHRFTRGGVTRSVLETAEVARLIQVYGVRPPLPERVLGTLSGGNQQKALLAKWLQGAPKLLVLHEPTQGVDIGSKKEIFAQLAHVADRGGMVLAASVEYEDLVNMCSRVLVLRNGRVYRVLSGASLSVERLVEAVYGSGSGQKSA